MKRAIFSLEVFLFYLFFLPITSLAVNSINATFDDPQTYTHYVPAQFIPGQVVPTGANYSDRPYMLGGDENAFKVENLATVSVEALTTGNFLRIVDMDDYAGYGASFDFYDHSYNSGCVRVSWDVLFEDYDYFTFYYRNGHADDPEHPAKSSIANIYTAGDLLYFQANDKIVFRTPYTPKELIHFDTFLDLDNNRWAVMMNGDLLFEDAEIIDAPFGAFIPGYGHDQGYMDGAMQVDNIEMVPMDSCNWPEIEPDCNVEVPTPVLTFAGTEDYTTDAGNFTRYKLYVSNWADIPTELFMEAPDLPPCGSNDNSSRTWVDILDGDGNRLYGFCALGSNDGLTQIWFAKRKGEDPPAQVKIRLHDRLCDAYYESNLVDINLEDTCPDLPVPEVEFMGTEELSSFGQEYTKYNLSITNWADYPENLFVTSSNLPMCFLGEGSRTIVEIYDENGEKLREICSVGGPEDLEEIGVAVNHSAAQPTALKVVLEDRICEKSVESPFISLTSQILKKLKISISGSGRVTSTDGKYVCDGSNMTQPATCAFDVPTGSTITLKAIPINGPTYTSSFMEWDGACSGVGNCTLTIGANTTVEARFAALGIPIQAALDPPVGIHTYSYSPVAEPELDITPSGCKPFAVGNISGGTLALKVGLPPFSGPVDIYLGLQAMAVNPFEIYLFIPQTPFGYTIVPLSSSGLKAWAKNQVDPIYQSFYGEIPVSNLPAGTYVLYTLVTPAGDLTSYYLWTTTFNLP